MEQLLLMIKLESDTDGIFPRFYPIMNSSQLKNKKPEGHNLKHYNDLGWKLESLSTMYDDKIMPYQVALFTRLD